MTLSRNDPQARAAARWAEVAARLRTVTPQAIGRATLTVGVILLVTSLSIASWPALMPFVVGVVIAYAVLPIANRLDRFMPRVLAALLAELMALAVIAGVVALVVPPLLKGLIQVASRLPTSDEITAGLASLETQIGSLQDPVRGIVLAVATQTAANLQAAMDNVVNSAASFMTSQVLGILGTASFVLGLLVIPAWVLTIVADERSIKRRGARLIAPVIRADVIAVARIVDRAFGTFLRVRMLLAIVAGTLVWVGLEAASALDIAPFPYAVTGAALLGMLQLIPELGFFLGFFPLLLVLAIGGPIPFATAVVVYWGSVRIASGLVETRVSRGVLDVHPGLLIPGIVVLSQFGVLWLLAAAPVIAILRDSVRYLAGRLAEPPQPAGVLPGDRAAARAARASLAPVPSVYRSAAAPRAPRTTTAGPPAPAPAAAGRTAGPTSERPATMTTIPLAQGEPSVLSSVTERSIAS